MTDMPHTEATSSTIANRLIETLGSVIALASRPAALRGDAPRVEHYRAAAQRREEARRAVDQLLR